MQVSKWLLGAVLVALWLTVNQLLSAFAGFVVVVAVCGYVVSDQVRATVLAARLPKWPYSAPAAVLCVSMT